MSKESGWGSSGAREAEEDLAVNKLMDRLFACSDDTERAIAQTQIQGHCVEGMINSLSRDGSNMISIGFLVGKSLSVEWRGRKLQSKVESDPRSTRHSMDVYDIYDEGVGLKISFVPAGADHCLAKGDLVDSTAEVRTRTIGGVDVDRLKEIVKDSEPPRTDIMIGPG